MTSGTNRLCLQSLTASAGEACRRLSALVAVALIAGGASQQVVAQEPSMLVPPGITFPYVVSPACPGEGCAYGEWLACDSIPIYQSAGLPIHPLEWLVRDQTFVVDSGKVIVRRPGAVLISQRTPQHSLGYAKTVFEAGDTLFVLNYLGEGFFDAIYRGNIVETEVFWPWQYWFPSEDYIYGGEVLQEAETEFWVFVRADDQTGWLWVDESRLTAANSLDPSPLECWQDY